MRKAAGTILTRVIIMMSALCVVLLNTHYLGVSGQGSASLIALGIMLVQALSNFIGGGALVFLIPRMQEGQAFWPGLAWAVLSSVAFYFIFQILHVVPQEFVLHACILGFLQSWYVMLQQVTLGKERMREFNVIVSIQAALVAVVLLISFEAFSWIATEAYVLALYVSFAATVLIYSFTNWQWMRQAELTLWLSTWKSLFRLGKYAQGGNILHLLNQRLNFVFLENLWISGRSATGVFSIALYIAEAIWTVSKSLSIIQYSRIANSSSDLEHSALTRKYLGLSMLTVSICSALLVFIPDSVYLYFFSTEAVDLKTAMWFLIPGILANGASIIYAHYFSGRGLHRENMFASGLGLAISVGVALWFIPLLGVRGAAISTSTALIVQCGWFVYRYHVNPPSATSTPAGR